MISFIEDLVNPKAIRGLNPLKTRRFSPRIDFSARSSASAARRPPSTAMRSSWHEVGPVVVLERAPHGNGVGIVDGIEVRDQLRPGRRRLGKAHFREELRLGGVGMRGGNAVPSPMK